MYHQLAAANNDNQQNCKQEQLEAENRELHLKLDSKEEEIAQLEEKIVKLIPHLDSEKEKNEKLQASINQFKESTDRQKFLAIGLGILNAIAIPSDLTGLNVKVYDVDESEEDDSEKVKLKFYLN